jgi:hypothetical protein
MPTRFSDDEMREIGKHYGKLKRLPPWRFYSK